MLLEILLVTACWIIAPTFQREFQHWWAARKVKVAEAKVAEQTVEVEVPPRVQSYCQSWYDEWAREESLERVKRLYAEYGDWDAAFQALLVQDREKTNG